MNAVLLIRDQLVFNDGAILTVKIWQVPGPVIPSRHLFKYSLFYGFPGRRLTGYDNERDKGDHKHSDTIETPYEFSTVEQLLADFKKDVETVRGGPI